jgi:hypothetical protein
MCNKLHNITTLLVDPALGQFIHGPFITALLITRPYSSTFNLASLILGNDKALWDEQGFAINSLAMNCPSAPIDPTAQ